MNQTSRDLNKLRENDIITLILYCLYKLTDDDDYAAISELAYTLDKDSLYKLCATFGGTTIKVPTLTEFKNLTKILLIFQYVNADGLSFTEACDKVGISNKNRKEIYKMYDTLSEIVDGYMNE